MKTGDNKNVQAKIFEISYITVTCICYLLADDTDTPLEEYKLLHEYAVIDIYNSMYKV